MIFGGIENCNQDADNAFGVGSVDESLIAMRGNGATGQKGACQVTDGRYDYGEIVAAVPKAVVGCLVAEDLYNVSQDLGVPGYLTSRQSDLRA